jgi:hypothetical protein
MGPLRTAPLCLSFLTLLLKHASTQAKSAQAAPVPYGEYNVFSMDEGLKTPLVIHVLLSLCHHLVYGILHLTPSRSEVQSLYFKANAV